MSLHAYTDAQLLRIGRGTPRRSAYAGLIRHDQATAPAAKAGPLPIVYGPGGHDGNTMPPPLPIDASDGTIRQHAKRLAGYAMSPVPGAADDLECLAHLYRLCRLQEVEPPVTDPEKPAGPVIARLGCARWWRRRLRSSVTRRTERKRIAAGVVHRAAQVYCSDAGVHRRRESAKRNHDLMEMLQVVNESTGEIFSVADLAERTTSNPELRRNELMTRCAGLEAIADQRGDRGLFVTWTLPSRFHAVHASGHKNLKYDGSTPRAGAAWFALAWARVRANLAKLKIRLYGIRVAEPHHDSTPHWHLLIFAPKASHRMIGATIAQAAFLEGDEPGAKKHRLKFELIKKGIDPKTGKARSAVGYVAKYLAKNVDGFQLELATERGADGELHFNGKASTAAERIRAWASAWGIRQFQFFGTPPVTIWRELRRLDEPASGLTLEAARVAADAGDYAAHVLAVGGVAKARRLLDLKAHRVQPLDQHDQPKANRYGEQAPETVKGVREVIARYLDKLPRALRLDGIKPRDPMLFDEPVITRPHTWSVLDELKPAGALPPRTRVNNCNRSENDGTRSEPAADLDRSRKPAFLDAGRAAGILARLGWRDDLAGSIADDLEHLADPLEYRPEDDQGRQEGMDAGAGCYH